ncbi:MAG: hypothetical protein Q7J60_08760 [Bradyrhizobium sp.]|nr:hypothetical protein [Bradyrhizobium sp.]
MANKKADDTPEIDAYRTVYLALKPLDPPAQLRVLRYSAEMLGVKFEIPVAGGRVTTDQEEYPSNDSAAGVSTPDAQASEDTEGINAVALKWMRRSSLNPKSLQALFSLGIDEIDLVAKSVPGNSKRERMRNVLLLKAIAAYLGTGAARVTYEQLKEAALHYNAYDAANFAANIKSFVSEVGGTKESGFTLTARGLTAATDLIREMLATKS